MTMTIEKTRKPPVRGVRIGYSPYCRQCSWSDIVTFGKGAASDAWARLHEHIRKTHPTEYEAMLVKNNQKALRTSGRDYSTCPDCKHKTVYLKLQTVKDGGDIYRCRHKGCGFFFWCDGDSPTDRANKSRWEAVQVLP